MAEWVILIIVIVVTGGAYAFNRRVYESQSLLVWVIAALIMAIGLIVYVFTKVNRISAPLSERYQIEDQP